MDSAIEKRSEDSDSDRRIADLEAALAERDGRLLQRDQYIAQLEELIRSFQHKTFGASSEKSNPDQLGLFNEAEEAADDIPEPVAVPAHTRQRKGRPALPEHLPREEIIHDLDDAQKVCPHDGTPLKEIAPQTSEQLDFIPAQVKVIRHVRKKYVCPCCEGHVATAGKPKQLLGKSWATSGLLATIAVNKYADALPLYRQSQIFSRHGIDLDRTTMAQWMVRAGQAIQPLINRLTEHILESDVVHMDETTVQVLDEPGKAAQSTSYMWVMGSGPPGAQSRVFRYADSRRGENADALLYGYRGALMVDGFSGYDRVDAQCVRLGCWAHARRGFVTAQKTQPKGRTGKADQALSWIGKLYAIEKQASEMPAEDRHRLRQEQSRPIIEDQLKPWLDKSLLHVPPTNKLGKALTYLANQWDRLVRYLDDGRYPIDNNPIERAIRPFAVGRKNWLFSKSQAGAHASANLYSLIETAKGHGLEPYAYLHHAFTHLPIAKTLDDIDALLPVNIKTADL